MSIRADLYEAHALIERLLHDGHVFGLFEGPAATRPEGGDDTRITHTQAL